MANSHLYYRIGGDSHGYQCTACADVLATELRALAHARNVHDVHTLQTEAAHRALYVFDPATGERV
jgi:hypothetical protein